ncbi:hypothetical protein K435DRAFT_427875 [Dendrothele bispora CBS 962.96]|uniref:Uncharacterized protein n=1 Tax=Dendrothele bispora (strain CBS 962.96) TaxID=1314807 RepID=A0A4S8L4D7_DENBC|nr:hypothetical protein K435DRAFT_427875 [Dendrothele bispora CBS 962.96]
MSTHPRVFFSFRFYQLPLSYVLLLYPIFLSHLSADLYQEVFSRLTSSHSLFDLTV